MVGTLALVVILGLAGWRAARLVARDTLTEGLRQRLGAWAWSESIEDYRSRPRAFLWRLLTCVLCLSVWMTAGAWLAWQYLPEAFVVVAAGAGVAALCALRD